MRLALITASVLLAAPVSAQTVSLIVGNEDYTHVSDVSRGDNVVNAAEELARAGLQNVVLGDATREELFDRLVEFGQMIGPSDAALIVLSGRFLKSSTETYFLPVDGQAGPMATLSANALPLSTVMAWLAHTPGKAVLVLATDDNDAEIGPFLTTGIGTLDIPQGVTVISGEPRDVSSFLSRTLSRPGRPFIDAARQQDLTVDGYAAHDMVLIAAAPAPQADETDRRADIEDWRRARDTNTLEAYQDYIEAHPDGEFVRMAESRAEALLDTPEARAERMEQALDLSRDARRDIQRDLTPLNYNTRGIDGIFGRGTRAAIASWQSSQGYDPTGYVTSDQVTRLDAQAERRALELEEEAEKRRREQVAADRAFWEETGALGDEAGLRAYINRYPDGEYSDVAQARLEAFEEEKRDEASDFDRRLWDTATAADTVEGYEEYLRRTDGNGAFGEEARARITELDQQRRDAAETDRYAREEQALNLSARTRRIVESRLDGLGLKPGPVDGVFDDDTRRAIRRYQAARNMPETGYLSEAVVVQLLADTVRQIFR